MLLVATVPRGNNPALAFGCTQVRWEKLRPGGPSWVPG